VVQPETVEQAVAILALAGRERLAVVPWGQGTQMHLGGVPRRYDVALSLAGLQRVVAYDAANFTIIAEAGLPLRQVYRVSLPERQFLPLGFPGTSASLGGLLVTNTSGVKRARYGGVRDLLLGLRVALPDGSCVRFGGRVVKNVAGYDMNKLYVGSLGAFGVVLETCYRLATLPEDDQALAVVFPSLAQAVAAAAAIQASPLQPALVLLLSADVARTLSLPFAVAADQVALLLNFDGLHEAVARQLRDSRAYCQSSGAQDAARIAGTALLTLWERLDGWRAASDPADPSRLQVRLGVLPSRLETALDQLLRPQRLFPQGGRWCADYVHGQITAHLPLAIPEGREIGSDVRNWLSQLRQHVRGWHGYCEVTYAPAALRPQLDMWGDLPGATLLRRYKQQFDPRAILNPGRYVAGL
jgi:glycolate oxidase FAD binding subunit